MPELADLVLHHLPMTTPEFSADPFPHLAAARAKHPWLATCAQGHVVHEYTAMRELFDRDETMRVFNDGIVDHMGAADTNWGRWMKRQIIAMPPERHRPMRAAFASSFTPRFANQLRPHIRRTMSRLLDEWAPKAEFDFDEFASWFPISVMFAIAGAPVERVAEVKADLEMLGLAFSMDPALTPQVERAFRKLEVLIEEVIAGREASGPSDGAADLLDLMLDARDQGGVTREQVADLLLSFLIAAYDTTKVVLTTIMWLLIDRPDLYRRCADDADFCRRVVEEALRYMGPSTAVRLTTEDIELRGVMIPKGTMLFFPYSVAGRDPATFPDGDRFDPDRPVDPARRHIGFGLGQHMCIGQHIARAEMQEALHLIAQRIRDPRLAGEIGWRPFPGIWGLNRLPISFVPG